MNNRPSQTCYTTDQSARGFTIIELLVVILIGLVILTIAVPAFRSMKYSSDRSLAVNALQAATQMARDVALSSGQDGAVVFVYDYEVGKVQIIPAVMVGTLREGSTAAVGPGGAGALGDSPHFDRDVFVPSDIGETLEIPRFWGVRGFASPRSLIDFDSAGNADASWYNSRAYGGTDPDDTDKSLGHWVYPETGFFVRDAQIAGSNTDGDFGSVNTALPTTRQSFMIRFDSRSGILSRDTNAALFVDPRNSRERPFGDRPNSFEQTLRADLAEDLSGWASRVLMSATLFEGSTVAWAARDADRRQQLIGAVSNDTILVKPVTRLAVYDERRMGTAIGARELNRVTQTLYMPIDQDDQNAEIEFDLTLFADDPNESEIVEQINQWIDGDTNFDGMFQLDDEPESRLYLIQSYTGELQEVLR